MRNIFINLFIVISSSLIALIVCEILIRVISPYDSLSVRYPLGLYKNELSTTQPQLFDEQIGYIYKKSFFHPSHPNFGNSLFSTYKDGTRSNIYSNREFFEANSFEQPEFDPSEAILVLGDSFVAGSEVSNNNSWPALLEKKIGKRVINGGVGGYSFTQSVLLGERHIREKKLQKAIFSLIPEDLIRAEYSIYQGVPRPYFEDTNKNSKIIIEHILNFKNFDNSDKKQMNKILDRYGFSFLLMEIIKRTNNNPEIFHYFGANKKENLKIDQIGCNLVDYIEKISNKYSLDAIILIQYPDWHFYENNNEMVYLEKYFETFKKCIEQSNVGIIDVFNKLNQIYINDKIKFNKLYIAKGRHMSPIGNEFIANEAYNSLKSMWYK